MIHTKLVLAIFAFTYLMIYSLGSFAQEELLSLRDAIERTLDNNPQFQEYQLRNQALDGELQTASLKPALRISSELENVIGTGDLNWFQGTEVTLALSRLIELGDKRSARSDVIGLRQNLLMAQRRVLELDLLTETTRRFIALAAAEQNRILLSRATELARETLASVSERTNVGRSPEAERARAQATLRVAELAEESAEFEIAFAKIRLSSLWGQLEPDFAGASANLLQLEDTADIRTLLSRLESNPAIIVYASEARLKQAELREAQSRRHSDIEVGAGIRYLAELNDTAFTVQASMPLSSKHRAGGAIVSAQANLLLVESERTSALLAMSAQLLGLDQHRRQAMNEVAVLQEGVLPQLDAALNETRDAFDSGRYSYVELSTAQQQLLDAEFALIEAATRAHFLRIEIENLSGETLINSSGGDTQ